MKSSITLYKNLLKIIQFPFLSVFILLIFYSNVFCQEAKLKINDSGYFETPGLNVLVFSNQYTGYFFDEKTAGIELIHHGVRTATDGAVRLRSTPEQWDQIPTVVKRTVDKTNNRIEVILRYKDYDFDSRVVVTAKDQGVLIDVYIDKPLPEKLIGNAGFNLEFLPASYFEKTYSMDGRPGILPLYPSGPMVSKPDSLKIEQFAGHSTFDDRGRHVFADPLPIDSGLTLNLAPEDPEQHVEIQSREGQLMLFDGRNVAQNGWYVVRSLIPANKTGKVVEWYLNANAINNWIRKPVIEFSQAGYHPSQNKIAVIEFDKNDSPLKTASLYKVSDDGNYVEKLTREIKPWGKLFRYEYSKFDFSDIKEPGLYFIKYADQKTETFPIDVNVYDNVWHNTLDVWFPVQMDHMFVKDAYKVWHGASNLDDARQAPINHQHFDWYFMGPSTETSFKPGEHINGLNVGGWYDAGDFDIRTSSQSTAVLSMVAAWEKFQPKIDETYIDETHRYVNIHVPDGKPDILQQIEHGALQLVAQQKIFGRAIPGIIVPDLFNYHHLGDGSTASDNLLYNPKLKPYEIEGNTSGTPDDRWAFTNKEPWINYASISALAAASRALNGYNDSLSADCLTAAKNAWVKEHQESGWNDTTQGDFFTQGTEIPAALQLLITTKDKQYADRFNKLIWPALDKYPDANIELAVNALPYFGIEYKNKLKEYVNNFKRENDSLLFRNPYGVPIGTRPWADDEAVISWAVTNYYLHIAFPEIIGPEYTLRGINYIFGCHPYSNVSFVSSVGTRSKKVAYGNNRADFTFIAGGVVPGVLILKPDFPENKENWPFFWGENEYVVDICAEYIFLGNAVNDLLKEK